MCRKLALSLGVATLLVSLGAGKLSAQFNPGGWIQTDGWNYLMPLNQNGGCGGGGDARMQGNWLTPHVIGVEDPKAGTSYFAKTGKSAKIDFPNTAGTTGWGGQGIAGDPTWVTNSFVEAAFPALTLAMPNGDVVDYQAIADYVNATVVPAQPVGTPNLSVDDVLGVATTYVNNTTGLGLEVEVCTASDDSVQVQINNILVTNVSACRGTGGGCDDSRRAILPPGVSKIATLVWEGGGGWGFRLGFRIGGVLITDATAGAAGLVFMGPGVSADVGQLQYMLSRSFPPPAYNCPVKDPVQVCLTGAGPGADGDPVVVEETVSASNAGAIAFSGLPAGATVTDVFPPPPPIPDPVVDFGDHRVIGTDNGGGSTTTYDIGLDEYTSVSTTGGDIWDGGDDFEFAYNRMSGDFDISIEWTSRVHSDPSNGDTSRWGKFGLMARAKRERCSRSTMLQDHLPNLVDTTRLAGRTVFDGCNNMYEVRVQEVDNYHPGFIRLTRRGNVFQGWYADVAPADPTNDADWLAGPTDDWGGSAPAEVFAGFGNSEHNSNGAGMLTAKFKILNLGGTILPVNTVPVSSGKKLTIPTTRGALNAGTVCYSVQYNAKGGISISGIAPSVAVVTGPSSMTFDASQVDPDGPGGFDNSHDIGGPPTAGSTSFSGGVYTQTASGNDIWDGGDQFQYAYKAVTGDFVATARITSRTDPVSGGRWGKHGLMARWTCDQNSKYSMLQTMLTTTGDIIDEPRYAFRINHLQNDTNRDYYIANDGTFTNRLPTWMKLVRRGDTVYGYFAEDLDANDEPDNWCLIGSDSSPNMPDSVLVGMAVTSHAGAQTGTITYDNVTIEAGADCGDSTCTAGEEITTVDFNAPDGTDPALGGLIVVVAPATPPALPFNPVITGGRLRLTQEGIGSSANAVWAATAPLALGDTGFVAEFDAYMSHSVLPGDANPADGMTFAVVQGDAALGAGLRGDGGGALGYEGNTLRERTECHPSFAVELDNWVGGGEPGNEPGSGGSPGNDGAYHVGLDVSASVTSIQTNEQFGVPVASLPNIFDADGVHVEVQYSSSGRVNVFVSDGAVPRTQVLSACVEPLAGEVLIGFTAGTGGATATQEVDNVVISSVCCEDTDTVTIDGATTGVVGTPVALTTTAGGLEGPATYTWSIVSGPGTITPSGSTATVDGTAVGDVVVKVVVDDGVCVTSGEDTHTITFGINGGNQKPNDMNGDGNLDISDPVATLNHLFLGGGGPLCGDGSITDPANLALLDANASGAIDISDPVFVLNFLFLGGPTPGNCNGDVTCPCIVIVGCPDNEACP